MKKSLYQILMQEQQRRKHLKALYDWDSIARPSQRIPQGDWSTWLIIAGRGFGKTRTGAESIRKWVSTNAYKRIALISNTYVDVCNVMIEGHSGLLSCYPENEAPTFERAKGRIQWKNGAVAEIFTAEAYEKLRGPQFDCAWVDEIAKFRHPERVWDQLSLSLRLGRSPRCIITTTPRPHPFIEKMIKSPHVIITRGSTFENKENLSEKFIKSIKDRYEGTQLGEQEIYGKVLSRIRGALWQPDMIRYRQPF